MSRELFPLAGSPQHPAPMHAFPASWNRKRTCEVSLRGRTATSYHKAKGITGTANLILPCIQLDCQRYVRFHTYKTIPFSRVWKYTAAHTCCGDLYAEGTTCMVVRSLVAAEGRAWRRKAH